MNYFLIYIAGYIITYLMIRYDFRSSYNGDWTKGDRFFALIMSSMSIFGVLAGIVILGTKLLAMNKDKASW